MKRLNPETGKPFVRGDTRADGFLFDQYDLSKVNKRGYYYEVWAHPDRFKRVKQQKAARYQRIKDWQRDYRKQHKENNRHQYIAANGKRRAAKLHRTPAWLSADQLDQIRLVYQLAADLTESTGVPHHVDHIVPLQGALVSGLHVPWNLQVLSAQENCSKGNSHAA